MPEPRGVLEVGCASGGAHKPGVTGVLCSVQSPFPPSPLPGQRAARLGRPRILHLSSILPTPGRCIHLSTSHSAATPSEGLP